MTKTKYDFISELFYDRKINQKQRERILELASSEISLVGTLDDRIKKIEEIVFDPNNEIKANHLEEPHNAVESSSPNYKDPYNLYKFLFEYNQNPVLRSTCHDIDSDELDKINEYCKSDTYDFNKHLVTILHEFRKHETRYFGGGVLNALIRAYLTGKNYKGVEKEDGWTTDRIHINWSSSELLSWVNKNPSIPPNLNENIAGNQEIELFSIQPQIISPISKEPIQNFTQLVLHFKNLFHLKSGNQSLRAIINRVNSSKNWDQKVEFVIADSSFQNNLEHFTNVEKLIQAYNKIIELVIEQNSKIEKPIVQLVFKEEKQLIIFSIHHLNGQYNKTIQNTLERPGQQYKLMFEKQINGLCNLYLKANFGNDNYAKINLWDGKKCEARKLDSFQGVEHILVFPKIKVE